jgi:hypothetical protein
MVNLWQIFGKIPQKQQRKSVPSTSLERMRKDKLFIHLLNFCRHDAERSVYLISGCKIFYLPVLDDEFILEGLRCDKA